MRAAIYREDGKIVRLVEAPASLVEMQCGPGESFFEIGDDEAISDATHYLAKGALQQYQAMAIEIETAETWARVSGIPDGAAVTVNDRRVTPSEGAFEIEAPGDTRVLVSIVPPLPYRKETRDVTIP